MEEAEAMPENSSILVVDDTPTQVRLLSEILRLSGYRVAGASDAEQALQALADERPDLILLDVQMPGMDGYALCRELRAAPATCDIPVIFISGGDAIADKVKAFASGGVDYIAKPFHRDEVLARVATHLALHGLRKHLEERVRERTAEFQEANARLVAEIAERRRAEENFRAVLESAPEAMVIVNRRHEIVLVNSRAETVFGYRRDELLGLAIEMLVPDGFRAGHARYVDGYLATPAMRPMGKGRGLHGRGRDGREFPAEISLSPVGSGDEMLVICAVRDITERVRIEQELRDSGRQLRELAAHHDMVREQERKRIAGEIHDELGSLLTALKMDLSLLQMKGGGGDGIGERLAAMRDLADQMIQVVRHVATQLRPTALNLGIVPALEWLVDDFSRRTGIACSFESCSEIAMDDTQATAVFRVVQESLTNVARHARADAVDIALRRDGGSLTLTVRDDGVGFDVAADRGGSFGLLGIRERARLLGGSLRIDSVPGQGTSIAITISLSMEES